MLRATKSRAAARRRSTRRSASCATTRVAGKNLMPASIACAKARVTTGEWAGALREVFGEYRPATGVEGQQLRARERPRRRGARARRGLGGGARRRGRASSSASPGLDGHSNGSEMIAVAAKHAGFDVVYGGIRMTRRGDRAVGRRGGRSRARAVGAVGLAPRDRAAWCSTSSRSRAPATPSPWCSAASCPMPTSEPLRAPRRARRCSRRSDFDLMAVMDRILDVIGAPRDETEARVASA